MILSHPLFSSCWSLSKSCSICDTFFFLVDWDFYILAPWLQFLYTFYSIYVSLCLWCIYCFLLPNFHLKWCMPSFHYLINLSQFAAPKSSLLQLHTSEEHSKRKTQYDQSLLLCIGGLCLNIYEVSLAFEIHWHLYSIHDCPICLHLTLSFHHY